MPSTDTRELVERLEKMASHPMALMEREWPEVQADLRDAAVALTRSPAGRGEGAFEALRKLAGLADGVDNGHCRLCGYRRLYVSPRKVGTCENSRCLSHEITAALASPAPSVPEEEPRED